jgi:GxxExxY protein
MLPTEALDPQTYAIIGAAMEVHKELGCGFLEAVYHDALARELRRRAIPFAREVELPVFYKGEPLACFYKADFLCFGEVIVEIKALKELGPVERAQVLNYLKAARLTRAMLLNFGALSLQYERLVRNHKH